MANIDDFKASLIGGGARANQFRVTITPPSGIAIGLDTRRTSFLVKAAALPSRAITEIPLKFRGRTIYMAGDQTEPETWEVNTRSDITGAVESPDPLGSPLELPVYAPLSRLIVFQLECPSTSFDHSLPAASFSIIRAM